MSLEGEEPGESEGQVRGVEAEWGMENHSCCYLLDPGLQPTLARKKVVAINSVPCQWPRNLFQEVCARGIWRLVLLPPSTPPYYLSCPYLPIVSLGLAGPMG